MCEMYGNERSFGNYKGRLDRVLFYEAMVAMELEGSHAG